MSKTVNDQRRIQTRPRGRPKSESVHQTVIAAALALIAEHGIEATSMEAIAAASKVSKATLYSHWISKEQLCLEAIQSIQMDDPLPISNNARADVAEFLRHLIQTWEDGFSNRILPRLIGEAADHPELAQAWRTSIILSRHSKVAELLTRAIEQGQLRPDLDVTFCVNLLLGPILYRRLLSGEAISANQFSEQLVSVVWTTFSIERLEGAV